MAKLVFSDAQKEAQNNQQEEVKQTTNVEMEQTLEKQTDIDTNEVNFNDPNDITINIIDQKSPLIILFGPPSCGKTMTLIRLTRYLKDNGYSISPITSFRPRADKNYQTICANFGSMINNRDAATATSRVNFMLLQVKQGSKTICQILEGPGELYFSPKEPLAQNPAYLNSIIASPNRKIWITMLEPDSTNENMDQMARMNYVNKIRSLKRSISAKDKVIFLFNKIDKTDHLLSQGLVRINPTKQEAKDLYPSIFEDFKNVNPITKIFWSYDFDFVPFQTGTFTTTSDGTSTFQQGSDVYPKRLWKVMTKRISGGWV